MKALGVVATILMVLIGFGISNQTGSAGSVVAALVVAGVVWLVFWVLGVLVSAQGQILKGLAR